MEHNFSRSSKLEEGVMSQIFIVLPFELRYLPNTAVAPSQVTYLDPTILGRLSTDALSLDALMRPLGAYQLMR